MFIPGICLCRWQAIRSVKIFGVAYCQFQDKIEEVRTEERVEKFFTKWETRLEEHKERIGLNGHQSGRTLRRVHEHFKSIGKIPYTDQDVYDYLHRKEVTTK